tara:strand:+ start:385 stop:2058 length:1674 start_codon:yes stop_codon:yes gene_type:complete
MFKNEINFKIPNKGLFFLSLGGIGEIGANCYLYLSDNKWIMIDLGLTFADEKYPGIDLLLPKVDFLDEISDNLEAVIISHGHEDHAGALAFLVDKIKCPIYATGFASSLIKNRLKEFGKLNSVNINTIDPKKSLNFDNFKIEFISTAHSIPEPYSILLNTKYGRLLHTADWKIDNNPLLGEKFNEKNFKKIGEEGILALIGDSTNADTIGFSKSESDVRDELIKIFSRYDKRIVTTCFSSNIARIESISIAAQKNNRKVVLIGQSMKRTIDAAIENGYLKNINNFISDDEASFIPRENLVIICTGSQGEKRSALYRIAYNSHPKIHLESEDLVIFSSKDIPGNEKSINNLQNLLIKQNIEVITSDDELVHVSGHCHAEEIKQMYQWTQPYISIPVHGEPKHLEAHSKLAQSVQVPITKILENGFCYKIAPDKPEIYFKIDTGKMIVEGKNIYNSENDFIKDRRKISFEGLVLISIIINKDYSIHKEIKISQNGLAIGNLEILKQFLKENFINQYTEFSNDQKSSDTIISDLIKKIVRKFTKNEIGKKPEVSVHIVRI